MTDFDKGDTVKVILEFKTTATAAIFIGDIGMDWFRMYAGEPMKILDVKVTKPDREWFFGDIVTLEDHPSEGFTFVDSDSTDISIFNSEDMRYDLAPSNEAYEQYGPYRLVAIHGIDLKVRGE